jgi:hypothetical protein
MKQVKHQNTLKTHEQFMIDFKEKQPELFNSLTVISTYKTARKEILVKDKYGICSSVPDRLLTGLRPTIMSAVNPHEYFINKFKELQPKLSESLVLLNTYKSGSSILLVKDKHGVCKTTATYLLQGRKPDIRSAVDKTKYFISLAKEIHKNFYDYSLVNYVSDRTLIQIISPYQTFWQTPNNHLQGKGCSILGYQSNYRHATYVKKGLRNKKFNSFKVYIIKCYNEVETFYKIGKTYLTVKKRYYKKESMPYNYEILHEIEFDKTFEEGMKCCQLESKLQLDNKKFKYKPLIKFGGHANECFSSINEIQDHLIKHLHNL